KPQGRRSMAPRSPYLPSAALSLVAAQSKGSGADTFDGPPLPAHIVTIALLILLLPYGSLTGLRHVQVVDQHVDRRLSCGIARDCEPRAEVIVSSRLQRCWSKAL